MGLPSHLDVSFFRGNSSRFVGRDFPPKSHTPILINLTEGKK